MVPVVRTVSFDSKVEVLFFGLGCQEFWHAVEVDLIGREPIQAGVRSDGIVKLQVATDQSSGLVDRLVGMQVDLRPVKTSLVNWLP